MKFLSTFFLFCAIFFTTKTSAEELTLQEALRFAYENNPEIKAQNYYGESIKSQKTKSYGGFLPKAYIDINSGSQKNRIGNDQRINGSSDSKNFSVSQDLFNGGSTIFDIKRAESEVQKSNAQNNDREQKVFFAVIEAYFNILRNEELLRAEKENAESQEKLFEHTKKKITARDATRAELAKASADYTAAANNVVTTENDLSAAKVTLSRLTGIPLKSIHSVQQVNDGFFNKNLDELDLKKLLEATLKGNPELLSAKHQVESARQKSHIAKSSLSPSVKLVYNISESKNAIYLNNRQQKNETIYVNFHVPLFNSGVEYAQIGEASNVLQSEKYNHDTIRNRLAQQVKESVVKIKNLYAKYESAKEQENADAVYVDALKAEERLGTKSIIDLLRAKQEMRVARLSRINFYYDRALALFELKSLVGELIYEAIEREEVLNAPLERKRVKLIEGKEN